MAKKNEVAAADDNVVQMKAEEEQPLGFKPNVSIVNQMLEDPAFGARMLRIADIFANSTTAPAHVAGNPAIVITAADISRTTGLNLGFVMDNMFQPAKGARVGLMSELVLAGLLATNSIIGDPEWETVGDWSKVQGNWIVAKGKSGSDYNKPNYTPQDEEGVGIYLTLHWSDRDEPTKYGPIYLRDQQPRFSTLWATDPLQQMKYKVLRSVVRRNRPNLLNQMPVGEEAYEHQHHGPDNAKVVGSSPASRLDKLATRGKKKAEEEPKAIDYQEEQIIPLDTAEKEPVLERQVSGDVIPPQHDEPPQMEEMFFDDDEDDQNTLPTEIWLNPRQEAYKITGNKTFEGIFLMALKKANDVQETLLLQEKNRHHIELLPKETRNKIKLAMDTRAQELQEA